LARLLVSEDFGLVAMATVVISFIGLLGATTSGLIYLILTRGIIARADVDSALRNRVATLSSGMIGKATERTSSHSGTSFDEAK
jgi:hypothetical protein